MAEQPQPGHEISERFSKTNEHLAIEFKKGVLHKFCKPCGHMMENNSGKLRNHFHHRHQDLQDEPEWLPRKALPDKPIHTNFYAFLINPSLRLNFIGRKRE